MTDVSHFTCKCGAIVSGEMVVDPSFADRVDEHVRECPRSSTVDPLAPVERLLGDVLDCAASNDLSIAWPAMQASREAVRLLLDVAREHMRDGYDAGARIDANDALLAFARGLEEK